jgi:putative inorganic carbon (hco3(-)) transporter
MDQLVLVILALFAAGYLAVAILDRPLALAAFCALLPTYLLRFGIGVPTTFLEVLFGTLFVTWFLMDGRASAVWEKARPWYPALGLVLLGATIGVAVAPDLLPALGIWRAYFVEPTLFFFLFTDIVDRPERRNMVLAALGLSLTAVAGVAVYQKVTGLGIPNPYWAAAETRRATSVYGFPNAIGLFGAPIVVLLVGRAFSYLRKRDLESGMLGALALAVAILGAVGILFAVSEGALIGIAAGLLTLGVLLRPTRAATLAVIIAGCLAVVATPKLLNYASDIVGLRDASSSVRAIVWSESWAMLRDHPVFGAGLSGYPLIVRPYHVAPGIEIFQYPHTLVLNIVSEIGLIGLAGFLWLLVLFLRDALWLHRYKGDWLHVAVLAAMVAVLVHGLVDVPYLKNDLAFLFMILLGLMAGMRIHPLTNKAE